MTDHPERIPDLPMLSRFEFSAGAAREAAADLQLQVDALKERIERIVDNVCWEHPAFGKIKLLDQLLRLSHDEDDLELLSKALHRLAPIMKQLDDLEDRLKIASRLADDPQWFAANFGDFGTALDDIERHLSED